MPNLSQTHAFHQLGQPWRVCFQGRCHGEWSWRRELCEGPWQPAEGALPQCCCQSCGHSGSNCYEKSINNYDLFSFFSILNVPKRILFFAFFLECVIHVSTTAMPAQHIIVAFLSIWCIKVHKELAEESQNEWLKLEYTARSLPVVIWLLMIRKVVASNNSRE